MFNAGLNFLQIMSDIEDTLSWERVNVIGGGVPSVRAYHTAVNTSTKLIIYGGMDGTKSFPDTHIFDTGKIGCIVLFCSEQRLEFGIVWRNEWEWWYFEWSKWTSQTLCHTCRERNVGVWWNGSSSQRLQ